MTEEILINVTPRETRVAVVENGVLQELHVERSSRRGLVGNIYCGRVARVLPGMQAAFVEIGLERAGFLHVSDMLQPFPMGQNSLEDPIEGVPRESECITKLLRQGQLITVQVIKDPIGSKGARLTTRLSLPSRYLVFGPQMHHVGVSIRIEDLNERERLKSLVGSLQENGGYIVRTAAEGAKAQDIEHGKLYLQRLWENVRLKSERAQFGELIHEDLPLGLRALRDFVTVNTERVRVDSLEFYERSIRFSRDFFPELFKKLEHYSSISPLFDLYGIEDEIQRALQPKVSLKSGGTVVFDQTEAMTTVDVNTGAFVGVKNLEETILKTNLEAAQAIVRQLRLRNIGGIIIIDFIDMTSEEHKEQVLRAFAKELERDTTKNSIGRFSPLGLLEMTRKRTRESLQKILCEPCPACTGRGSVKTAETVCNEIFREIMRTAKAYETRGFLVRASQAVVDRLLDEGSPSVAELEEAIDKPLQFQIDALYAQEQFDVVLM